MTKGNPGQPPADRTLSRGLATSGLDRVRAFTPDTRGKSRMR